MLDLILRNRIDVLKNNLKQIQQMLSSEQKHQKYIERLNQIVKGDSIPRQRDELLDRVNQARFLLVKCSKIQSCPLKLERKEADIKLQDFAGNLDHIVNGILNEVEDIAQNIQEIHSEINKKLEWIFDTDMMETVVQLIDRLSDIKQSLDTSEINKSDLLRKNWEKLQAIEQECQDIFDEYVDFLRGIAMRDTGFDANLCKFAEELIEEIIAKPIKTRSYFRRGSWRSLAILSRQERMSRSVAKLIRIGYPEWTVWALPLIVSDFGHLVVSEHENRFNTKIRQFKQSIEQQGINKQNKDNWTEEELRHLIVDAYATYTLGAAYIWAVIVLRFNPSSAYKKKEKFPSDNQRFQVMLATLSMMNKLDPSDLLLDPPYTDMIESLNYAWETAIQQAQSESFLLTQDTENQDTEKAKQLIKNLWPVFHNLTFTKYPSDEWIKIHEDLFSLFDNNQNEFPKNPEIMLQSRRIAHLLNAAWWSRIKDPERIDNITQKTLSFLNQIVFRPSRPAPGPNDSRRGSESQLV